MNRELAIERLNKMRRVCDMEECNINCELCDEALDLAIEALQEPITIRKVVLESTNPETLWEQGMRSFDGLEAGLFVKEKHQLSGETSTNTPTCNHTCNKKQVTSKLKNPDDSLLTEDSEACKEQKSKLDCISRADAIAYIDRIINSGLGKHKSLSYIRKYIYALPPVTPTVKAQQADTLIIATALWYFAQDSERNISDRERAEELREQVLAYGASMCKPVTPIERTGEWIPVSERLPENNGRYLVSYEGIIGMRTNILHYGVPSPLHTRGAEKCFYDTDREYGDVPYEDVIAWQPLPDPYKGGDTE